MSTQANYTEGLLLLAETLGEVKTRTERLESEFATNAKPIENATSALSAALAGIKALQFHVVDNNLGALSARVEEMRKAVDEQVGVIALELKKADETNAAKAGADAEALRSEIVALQSQLGSLVTQFGQQLERVEFAAKEEAKKLQLIPGPAGASLNPRGTFIDGETYNRLDVVSWLGSSYIATVDGVTEKPSKNSNQWQVLASRGGNAGGASTLALTDVYGKPSNGQLLIGNGTDYVNATLTAGNGIAVTNGSGSITIEATGAVNYQGAWNASTNSPTLTSSVGTKGYYYVVSVAGSTNLNGITDWQAGDWAVFNGTAWEKIDNTDRVSSVFGRTGAVVGVSTDYSSVGITNTAIGASNPSTGAFTTLSATGNLTVNGTGSINGGSGSAAFAIKETASAGTALSLTNRNSTQTWGIAVDAAAIDDKLLAFISGGTVALSLNATNWNATFAGNLTVSGTLTVNSTNDSSIGGSLFVGAGTSTDSLLRVYRSVGGLEYLELCANNGGSHGNNQYTIDLIGTGRPLKIRGSTDAGVTFTDRLTISAAGVVAVPATTASTSTSTGALVVSGGVGVAGAINAGGDVTVFGTGGLLVNNVAGSGNDSKLRLLQSGVSDAYIKNTATSGNIAIGDGGGDHFTLTKATGNGTLRGNLTVNGTGTSSVAGVISAVSGQFTGTQAPASGSGAEVGFFSGGGYVFGYNRSSSASLPLYLQHPGGNVLVGTTTDSGEKLQVSGTVGVKGGSALRLYNPSNSAYASIEMDSNNVVNVNYTTAFGVTIRTQGGTASTPASASAAGIAGTIQWDASYIYVCTAANTWKRVAIATW